MPGRGIRVRVVCEDSEHEAFARQLLADIFKIDRRAIDVEKAPKGEGAASDWVMRRYRDKVVSEYRQAHRQRGLAFLVMVDGDNVGFTGRMAALGADQRAPGDRIVLVAPTWSVETWVLWLRGDTVNESEPTKERLPPEKFREQLKEAISRWQTASQTEELPSLAHARVELKRLPYA